MSYFAQKKNRIIQIAEEKAEEYSKMGYVITNNNGEVVVEAAITSVADAKKENAELKEKLEKANEKIALLKEENAELKERLEKQSKKPATKAATKASEKTE